MKANLRFHRKVILINTRTLEIAVAELKVFDVPTSVHYPDGLKYSLFLVLEDSGVILVGFDNHRPKGPHLHLREKEQPYKFSDVEQLVEDFLAIGQEGRI